MHSASCKTMFSWFQYINSSRKIESHFNLLCIHSSLFLLGSFRAVPPPPPPPPTINKQTNNQTTSWS